MPGSTGRRLSPRVGYSRAVTTCLKKCYYETYRFSEGLDFTLTDPSQIDRDFLAGIFRDVGEWVYEQTGIELPEELQELDVFENIGCHIPQTVTWCVPTDSSRLNTFSSQERSSERSNITRCPRSVPQRSM